MGLDDLLLNCVALEHSGDVLGLAVPYIHDAGCSKRDGKLLGGINRRQPYTEEMPIESWSVGDSIPFRETCPGEGLYGHGGTDGQCESLHRFPGNNLL